MAAALLARDLAAHGVDARVHSAGTTPWDGPATAGACTVVSELGLSIEDHRSRSLTPDLIAGADLILGMTRVHVHSVVTRDRAARARTFLLGELARLGTDAGPRPPGTDLQTWLTELDERRPPGEPPGRYADEVADPVGEPITVYRATRDQLAQLTATVAALIAGAT